ncbi:MAG: bifunctional 2',3'-cyclic-nucleotide 2'-phosphodiesterase/3'-nucleotidase [Alphaproteobacteria bacterium]
MTLRTLLALSICLASLQALAEKTVELNILETTDIHTHIVDYDYYADKPSITLGLARTASLIRQARESLPNTILVDNGDLIQGNPLGDYMARVKGLDAGNTHPVFKAMNLLDYDVGNLGNHEFNYGLDFLNKAIKGANFPYVSSNTFNMDDTPFVKPYVILNKEIIDDNGEKENIKIAIMGFVPPQIMQWDAKNLNGKLKAIDIDEAAKETLKQIAEQNPDITIAIAHTGINPKPSKGMDENAAYYLSQIEGIDGLLLGHSHSIFPSNAYKDIANVDITKGTINGIAATMPGFWGSHLGRLHFKLAQDDSGKWSIKESRGSVTPIYKRDDDGKKIALVDADSEIVQSVAEEHKETIDYMNKAVGKTLSPIYSYFALAQDDPSIQIVTAAQTKYVEDIIKGTELEGLPILSAGAPFKAGGRGGADYYTNIPAGPLKLKNVSDLYIYPNTLQVVKLKGSQVIEWLEMSAQAFNQINPKTKDIQTLLNPDFPSYNFDTIDGINYEIDLTKAARYNKDGDKVSDEHRVINVTYQGKPIDLEQDFLVATNNYRAQGGGTFPSLDGSNVVIEAPDENRNILASYIQDQGDINPAADNNWKFVQNLMGAYVVFPTGKGALQYLTEYSPFEPTDKEENGFVLLKLK